MAKAPNVPWTREHFLIALNLYCKLPFGKLHKGNPLIIEVAQKMGRTPSSLAMKLCNFASLDSVQQARGIKGLAGATKQDRECKKSLWTISLVFPECRFFAHGGEPLKFSFFQFPFLAFVFRPFLGKRLVTGLCFELATNCINPLVDFFARKFFAASHAVILPETPEISRPIWECADMSALSKRRHVAAVQDASRSLRSFAAKNPCPPAVLAPVAAGPWLKDYSNSIW